MYREYTQNSKNNKQTGDFCLGYINHLPLILPISSLCFTLFTAIPLNSLISCIIKQPVYISQSGSDDSLCVCVFVVGPVFTSVITASWNQTTGTLCRTETIPNLLVLEDTRQMIILWSQHSSCLGSYLCISAFLFLAVPEREKYRL